MLKEVTLTNGKKATAAFLKVAKDGSFEPVDEKDATLVKLIHSDGSREFCVPSSLKGSSNG